MFFYWGMSKVEIGRFLDVSEGTVRYRLRCAAQALYEDLRRHGVSGRVELTG